MSKVRARARPVGTRRAASPFAFDPPGLIGPRVQDDMMYRISVLEAERDELKGNVNMGAIAEFRVKDREYKAHLAEARAGVAAARAGVVLTRRAASWTPHRRRATARAGSSTRCASGGWTIS